MQLTASAVEYRVVAGMLTLSAGKRGVVDRLTRSGELTALRLAAAPRILLSLSCAVANSDVAPKRRSPSTARRCRTPRTTRPPVLLGTYGAPGGDVELPIEELETLADASADDGQSDPAGSDE